MRWAERIRLRIRDLFHRARVEEELDAELDFYVEEETERHRARGVDAAEADRLARRSVGSVTRIKEYCRDARGLTRLDEMAHDIRYALRTLRRSPAFTLAAILIAALGIGANAAAFAVVNAVLLKPPPFGDPSTVASVFQDSDDGTPWSSSFPATRDMATYTDVFAGVAATSSVTLTWETTEGPRQALAEFVTASYLPVLGVEPSLGRWFEPALDNVGAGNYAVVGHRLWRTQFGSDPGVVGRSIRMNGQPVVVLGVGPEGFNGIGAPVVTDFWLSISSVGVGGNYRIANLERRQDHWYQVRARLAPGVSVAQAQSRMDALAARLADEYPHLNRGRDITVFGSGEVRVNPAIDAMLMPAGGLLLGIVGLVLVLACANLATLMLVRGFSRGHEVAVRRALGASRLRVARIFLVESLVLAVLGGAGGLILGRWVLGIVPSVVGPIAAAVGAASADVGVDLSMDARVVLFTLTLVVVTGVLFGLAPALRSTRSSEAHVLREEGHSLTPNKRESFVRKTLVSVQVAVSLVLLVVAAQLTQSLVNIQQDPGVDANRVAYLATDFAQGDASSDEQQVRMQDLRDRTAALPGVTSVAFTSRLPVQPGRRTGTIIDGYTPPTGTDAIDLPFAVVSPDYFQTVGVRLVGGRGFERADTISTVPVALVNQTAARRFWGGDPVGRRFRPQASPDGWVQVVGVVEDSKVSSLAEPPSPMLYFPVGPETAPPFLLARTDGDPAALLSTLRGELQAVSPVLPLSALGTLGSRVTDSLTLPSVSAAVVATFSLLAVLLASLGIYAIASLAVTRRSVELGIRIALGAGRGQLIGMVMQDMLVTVVVGLVVGLALAFGLGVVLEPALYGVSGTDLASYLVGALLMLAVAAAATYLPARRAAGLDGP